MNTVSVLLVGAIFGVVAIVIFSFIAQKISDFVYDRRSKKREEAFKEEWRLQEQEELERAQTALREKIDLIQLVAQYDDLNDEERAALQSAVYKVSESLKTRKRLENE
jgi:uncharacterized membrane protein YhiD involved in acid resistance